jgi:cell wall-associated NlpC family hydrolase
MDRSSLQALDTRPERFVAEARKLLGAKWRHRGRKAWAVDCVGLVVLSFRGVGIEVGDEERYGREPWEDRLRKGCSERWGAALAPSIALPGDVALIQWSKKGPSHLAIVGDRPQGGLTLIHAHNRLGVIEQSMTLPLSRHVVEVYRPWRHDVG